MKIKGYSIRGSEPRPAVLIEAQRYNIIMQLFETINFLGEAPRLSPNSKLAKIKGVRRTKI